MPCRVNHVNKTTGVTYVYEYTAFWDKEKKQSRNKQVCVGKLDPVSGEFIPSKRLKPEQAAIRDPAVTASAEIVGPSIVLRCHYRAARPGTIVEILLSSRAPADSSNGILPCYSRRTTELLRDMV